MKLMNSLPKIGFDLDGVIIPDLHIHPLTPVERIYEIRDMCKPIFKPSNDSVIITARPHCDHWHTRSWLLQNDISPDILHMQETDDILDQWNAAQFKSNKCLELGVEIYVESDTSITSYMRSMLGKRVEVISVEDLFSRITK